MKLLEAKHIIKSIITEQVDHNAGCESIEAIGIKLYQSNDLTLWGTMKPLVHRAMVINGCMDSQQPSTTSDEMYINPECTEEEIEAGADGCFSATGHFTDIDHDCPGCPQQE